MVGVKVPSLAVPVAPHALDGTEERTLIGIAPGSLPGLAEEQDEDSVVTSANTLTAELAAKNAELARLRAELAVKLTPVAVTVSPSMAPPSRAQWHSAGFRALVAFGALMTALTTWLGVRNATTLEPRIDNAEAKQATQKAATLTVEDRVKALEKYAAALARYSDCLDAERDSAIERGTGHVVDGERTTVEWIETNAPQPKPRTLWKNPPWSIAKDEACPSKPAPPRPSP